MPPITCLYGESFFFLDFFFKKKKCDRGILGKKEVKLVELQKFESLGGSCVTFEILEVKV
jgi:hypothetical protein